MTRLVTIGMLLFAVSAAAQEPPVREKRYKSPQEVFAAAMAAGKRKDYKAMLACVAPEAQKDMASGFAWAALNIKEGNRAQLEKALKPLFDVLNKHGLTEKATKNIKLGDDPKTAKKSRRALKKMIKNHGAFAEEYLLAQDKIGAGEREGETKTKLEGVKVKGDRATGTMVIDFGGDRPLRNPVEFVKINGGWKMIPELIE